VTWNQLTCLLPSDCARVATAAELDTGQIRTTSRKQRSGKGQPVGTAEGACMCSSLENSFFTDALLVPPEPAASKRPVPKPVAYTCNKKPLRHRCPQQLNPDTLLGEMATFLEEGGVLPYNTYRKNECYVDSAAVSLQFSLVFRQKLDGNVEDKANTEHRDSLWSSLHHMDQVYSRVMQGQLSVLEGRAGLNSARARIIANTEGIPAMGMPNNTEEQATDPMTKVARGQGGGICNGLNGVSQVIAVCSRCKLEESGPLELFERYYCGNNAVMTSLKDMWNPVKTGCKSCGGNGTRSVTTVVHKWPDVLQLSQNKFAFINGAIPVYFEPSPGVRYRLKSAQFHGTGHY
jgi:hypothetical protein